jgi:hypothetical protein
MAHPFRIVLPLAAGLLLGAATPPAPDLSHLTARHRHDLTCAAAFAVVAAAQSRGEARALALPPLNGRGPRYLGLVGERVAAEADLSGEAVHDLLNQAARRAAGDGSGGLATATPCLPDLDAALPRRPAPDALACRAMLDVYAQVLAGRDPASPLAATLARESAALGPRADALIAGRGENRDAALDRERSRVREALNGGPATIDADDFAACRKLAKG